MTRKRDAKEEKATRQQWAIAQIDKGVGFSELTALTETAADQFTSPLLGKVSMIGQNSFRTALALTTASYRPHAF